MPSVSIYKGRNGTTKLVPAMTIKLAAHNIHNVRFQLNSCRPNVKPRTKGTGLLDISFFKIISYCHAIVTTRLLAYSVDLNALSLNHLDGTLAP